jgi:hypothetical protein
MVEGVQGHFEFACDSEEVPQSPNFQPGGIDDEADELLSARLSAMLPHLAVSGGDHS